MLSKTGKFFLLAIFCLLVRLMPFRVPNIEPLTASLMPLGRAYGRMAALFFVIGGVLVYDLITGTLGAHTFFTAGAFGILAVWSGSYFRDKQGSIADYVRFAVIGTLFFDAATGLIPGPVFYGQPIALALAGQIPFTALHLLGNIAFAATLSPAIYHLLIKKRKPDLKPSLANIINPKTI